MIRVHDQGGYYRVTASAQAVYDWSQGQGAFAGKGRWPGSQFRHFTRGVSFTFDKRNGDLVDLTPDGLDGADVLALSHDLQAIGEARLKRGRKGRRVAAPRTPRRGRRVHRDCPPCNCR